MLGQKIKEWDNMLSNTVEDFERLFGDLLNNDPNTEVEILEPYTTNGRYLLINGQKIPHLFGDNEAKDTIYLLYDAHGNLLQRYGRLSTAARELDASEHTLYKSVNYGVAFFNGLQLRRQVL